MSYTLRQRILHDVYKNKRRYNGRILSDHSDRLSKSLEQRERRRYDSDGESWRDYGFIRFEDDATDEEIADFFRRMEVHISSPWDCTGRVFTNWIDWHKNPNGSVSYVHRMSLDL